MAEPDVLSNIRPFFLSREYLAEMETTKSYFECAVREMRQLNDKAEHVVMSLSDVRHLSKMLCHAMAAKKHARLSRLHHTLMCGEIIATYGARDPRSSRSQLVPRELLQRFQGLMAAVFSTQQLLNEENERFRMNASRIFALVEFLGFYDKHHNKSRILKR